MDKPWKCSCGELHETRRKANNCDNCTDTIKWDDIKPPVYLPWEKAEKEAKQAGVPRRRQTWSKR